MPPRRRARRRKYPQQSGYLDTAAKALTVAYAVRKLINVEYQSLNVTLTSDPSSSGAVVNFTGVGQGDDRSNRQGNKIRAKYLKVSGIVRLHASATASNVRMMIVRDNNGSTTQPAITDLFGSVANFQNGMNKIGDPQTNSRFSILWDKKIVVNTNSPNKYFEWSSSLDHHIFYSGTAPTDEGKGNCYLFIASNEATNDPIVSASSMFKFIDN